MAKKPYIIGVCGGTCSGKSTITKKLLSVFEDRYKIAVFHMDSYYKNPIIRTIAPITRIEYVEANHPESLQLEKLYADYEAAITDISNDMVIIEGLFSFYLDKIRDTLDLKVYIDLKSDERIFRRIKRWMDRQTIDEIALRYLDTVRYRHDEFVEPMRWHADIVLNGTLDTHQGTKILVTYIESQL